MNWCQTSKKPKKNFYFHKITHLKELSTIHRLLANKKKDFVKRKYANCESKEGNLLKSDLELTNEGP